MHTKEAILEQLTTILVKLFEVDPTAISLSADLYKDFDIDSIDAVDMVMELQDLTGKKMGPTDFKNVRTVGDIVNVVYLMMQDSDSVEGQAKDS